MTKRNPEQSPMTGTQQPGEVLSGLERIRAVAEKDRHVRFTNLLHHITIDLLRESYCALKRTAAPGVDGETWKSYSAGLEDRLKGLHARVQGGRYRAQPSLRTYIPKADGKMRPLGIAALEDKIVQHATVQVLNAIYEPEFQPFSYGFRPGRKQHDALDALWVAIMQRKVNWVLDADIRSFFDTLQHEWLMKFVEHRIADQRILRLLRKWLRAGVSEDGQWSRTTVGTPQGAVISPLQANIYLHYVLDLWTQQWRKSSAKGEVYIVRYADDFVMGFQHREDAERFLSALKERFARFGLELHQEKTRLIEFGRLAEASRAARGEGKPETFNFLGFTHICAKRRKDGRFTLLRQSISKRLRTKVCVVRRILLKWRHHPVPQVGRWLRQVVQGYFNYHAVPGNLQALKNFRYLISRGWLTALRRRSQKGSNYTWERMMRLIDKWLPQPAILHPYPNQRLRVSYSR